MKCGLGGFQAEVGKVKSEGFHGEPGTLRRERSNNLAESGGGAGALKRCLNDGRWADEEGRRWDQDRSELETAPLSHSTHANTHTLYSLKIGAIQWGGKNNLNE